MDSRFIGSDGCRWLPCVNDTAEVIPAYAVLRYTGMDANSEAIKVGQCNQNGKCDAFNGPVAIPVGGTGNCTEDTPNWARVPDDTGDGVNDGSGGSGGDEIIPVNGNIWGPRAGSWTLHNNQSGFRIIGGFNATEHRVFVRRDPTSIPDEAADGSGSSGSSNCIIHPAGDRVTLRLPDGCNADGSQRWKCVTIRSSGELQVSEHCEPCDEGSG